MSLRFVTFTRNISKRTPKITPKSMIFELRGDPGAGSRSVGGRGEGGGEEKLYIATPDQPLHGGFTGSRIRGLRFKA